VAFGQAAYAYGSMVPEVEEMTEQILKWKFPVAKVSLSNAEMFVSVANHSLQEVLPQTFMYEIAGGCHLNRLSLLVELAKDFHGNKVPINVCFRRLDEIHCSPHPFNFVSQAAAFIMVGAGLSPVLGGSWYDVPISAVASVMVFILSVVIPKVPPFLSFLQRCDTFILAFCAGTLAAVARIWAPQVNHTLVTLSALAIPLPGWTVTAGVAEITWSRTTAGIAHLVAGIICLGWLVLGGWVGQVFVDSVASLPPAEYADPIPMVWQALWIPLLATGLPIAFQSSYRDILWIILLEGGTYGLNYGFSQVTDSNFGTFFSTFFATMLANVWSRHLERPATMVLLPVLVFQVSGSIGFRGLVTLIDGETELGVEQVTQMFYTALVIIVGLMAGDAFVPSRSVL